MRRAILAYSPQPWRMTQAAMAWREAQRIAVNVAKLPGLLRDDLTTGGRAL